MIAVDWGTSQLRAYRLDAAGAVVETRERPEGILAVPQGGFPDALSAITEGWDARHVIMSGMVGSRQGWLEVPYVACPAGLAAIAKAVRRVDWRQGSEVMICPGLACRDATGVPDVMRGEEVQVMGALALHAERDFGSIMMAGTHSKHVRIERDAIAGFTTYMTGEVFAVLRAHSILGRTIEAGSGGDDTAFAQGVTRAREPGGLLHHLFGVRTQVLFGEVSGGASADYLSGILIGHTLVASAPRPPLLIVGAPVVAERYQRASTLLGISTQILASERATIAGLMAVKQLQ